MTKFSNLLTISLFTLSLIALFASCKKDDPITPATGDAKTFSPNNGMQQVATSRSNGEDELCFEITFPVSIELPNGSTQAANSMEELETIYENWVAQHPGDTTCPAVVYPITVTLEDGTAQTVHSDDELFSLLEACFQDEIGWEDCFTIAYPVTVVYPDGTTATAGSDLQLMQLFDNWYSDHPNDTLDPTVAYPINVTLADGTSTTVGSDAQMEALFEDCYGDWGGEEPIQDCFAFVFPLQVALPDGTTQTANSDQDLDDIFMAWFDANPNSMEFPTLVFPLQVKLLETGETLTLENETELTSILETCYGGVVGFEECFSFNYPITLVLPDGTTPAVNSDEELVTVIEAWYEANPNSMEEISFQYPLSVTLSADGSVVTVNSDSELEAIFANCYDCLVNGGGVVLGGQKDTPAKLVVKRHSKIAGQQKARISKALIGKAKSKRGR
ncbi:MAG: hypothetical protein H6577_27065 [Lewinellaceae bacterium]|nr:hypothetical protein [Saprospiraceae bacterium]MCB9341804.1 hypothetical protein [Lewinellaceae bacterium]